MEPDVDAEVIESVRSAIEGRFGRYLGTMIEASEAVALIEELQGRGLVIIPQDEAVLEEAVTCGGAGVRVNVNVTVGADDVAGVLDSLRDRGFAP